MKEKEDIRKGKLSQKEISDLLVSKQPIGISFFGDYGVASSYSATEGFELEPGKKLSCGRNCISAYQLKKKAIFVDIFDPFNIVIIMGEDYLSEKAKEIISKTYNIKDVNQFIDLARSMNPVTKEVRVEDDPSQNLSYAYHPLKRFIGKNLTRETLREENYLVPNELMEVFLNFGYAGYANPRTPA